MPAMTALGPDECLALLRAGWFGRFAVQTDEGRLIVPVNYVVGGDSIVASIAPLGNGDRRYELHLPWTGLTGRRVGAGGNVLTSLHSRQLVSQ